MSRKLVFVLVLLLVVTPLMARDWVVPAAAHAPGAANTNWRSDLRIVNPSGTAASVRIDLLPQGADNTARSQSATVSVPAQGQLSLVDVLSAKFSFSGNAALYVRSSEQSLVITSRTYNEAAGGSTYGQFIPGVAVTDALAAGQQGHLIYVTKNNDYRTNVGFAGTTATAGQVTIKLFDASGIQLGSGTFPVQAYGQTQVNDVFAATNSAATSVARAVVTATVPVVAYSSVIDNRTGDPIAVVAAKPGDASTVLAIPGIAHLAGAASSLWRSDVRIFQPDEGDDNASVVLTYYAGNTANPAPVTKVVSIGANRIVALDDLLLSTFGISDGSGGLADSGQQRAAGDVANVQPVAGRHVRTGRPGGGGLQRPQRDVDGALLRAERFRLPHEHRFLQHDLDADRSDADAQAPRRFGAGHQAVPPRRQHDDAGESLRFHGRGRHGHGVAGGVGQRQRLVPGLRIDRRQQLRRSGLRAGRAVDRGAFEQSAGGRRLRDPSLHARRSGPRLPHQRRQLHLDADGDFRQRHEDGTA
jgi:hypothetical protein